MTEKPIDKSKGLKIVKIDRSDITEEIREGMDLALADLRRFDETSFGKQIRVEYEISSIVDVCDNRRDVLFDVLTKLAEVKDKIDIKYLVAFMTVALLGVATEKYPDFIADAIMTNMKFRVAVADIVFHEILSFEVNLKLREALASLQGVHPDEVTDGRKVLIPRVSLHDEDISNPVLLKEFEQTEMGRDIMRDRGVSTIDDIWDDKDKVHNALNNIDTYKEGVDVLHFRAFLVTAIERQPDVVLGFYKQFRYAAILDPETIEIVVVLFKENGYEEVTPEMFIAPT